MIKKKAYLFDWGDTIMRDFPGKLGPMYSWDKVEIMPYADTMLKELSKKAHCYLATNAKDSSKIDIIKALQRVHIDTFFKDIFCYKEIGFSKPSKEYFDTVISRLELDKENIIMIGDNIDSDIYGVQKIGIDTILYDTVGKYRDYKGLKISNLMTILDLE
jgi:FMN hydrolase / 5-amino-6-(5-phospho-D-ribitylamino)uracil phosphatase